MSRKKTPSYAGDMWELTKPRIVGLSLVMSGWGYYLGLQGPANLWDVVLMVVGIGLVGASCGALNMVLERDVDAQMRRTANRPLPSGRVPVSHAVVLGVLCGVAGEAILFWGVNTVTALLGILTLITYLGIYTPSKRMNSASTLIGAVPGALPPLMGFTAARGEIAFEGVLLFAILFLWQVPHFLAIAWMYREDYARGGFPILSVVDAEGKMTANQLILYSLVLLPLSLVPTALRVTGAYYFVGALILGLLFVAMGVRLARNPSRAYARKLFLYSVIYLPMLSLLMVWDRLS